jgi:uncharacterized lipoprotein YmbA
MHRTRPDARRCLGLLAALVLFAGACSSVPPKRFYQLINAPAAATLQAPAAACQRNLVITALNAAAPYDQKEIVFRTDHYEVKHYNYRLWISNPNEMFGQLVAERLRGLGLFTSVEPAATARLARPLTLVCEITRMEEIDEGDTVKAHLAMRFRLREQGRDENLLEYTFDRSSDVPPDDELRVLSVVAATSDLYNGEAEQLAARLRAFAKDYPGCAGTIRPQNADAQTDSAARRAQ